MGQWWFQPITMAAKSNRTQERKFSTKLVLLLIVTLVVFVYLWHKRQYLLSKTDEKQQENWWSFWIPSFQSSHDHMTSDQTTVVDMELYSSLFSAVKEDILLFISFLIKPSLAYVLDETVWMYIGSFICFACFTLIILLCHFGGKSKTVKDKKKHKKRTSDEKEKEKTFAANGCCNNPPLAFCGNGKHLYLWLSGLMVTAFLLTIPWEFVRLYQSKVAERVTHAVKGMPPECVSSDMTIWQTVTSLCRYHLSWTPDPCLQYHKAMHVDPFWEVSPIMVVSSALSHFIIHPLEIVFGGLGRALRQFFAEIPTPWQPVMLIFIFILCVLILIMLFGYRIHVPMLFKFEPKTPVYLQFARGRNGSKTEAEVRKLDLSIEPAPERRS